MDEIAHRGTDTGQTLRRRCLGSITMLIQRRSNDRHFPFANSTESFACSDIQPTYIDQSYSLVPQRRFVRLQRSVPASAVVDNRLGVASFSSLVSSSSIIRIMNLLAIQVFQLRYPFANVVSVGIEPLALA